MQLPAHDRDFKGWGGGASFDSWPDGKRLAVSVVVSVEEGAELSIGMGDEANEFVYKAVQRVDGHRDLCMESHFEYGTRAGWPRLRAVLRDYGTLATLGYNGACPGRNSRQATGGLTHPHRRLEKFLAPAQRRAGVWFARRNQIAHAWRAANGLPPWTPAPPSIFGGTPS